MTLAPLLHTQGTVCIEASETPLPLARGAVFVDDDPISRVAHGHLAESGVEHIAREWLSHEPPHNHRRKRMQNGGRDEDGFIAGRRHAPFDAEVEYEPAHRAARANQSQRCAVRGGLGSCQVEMH